MYPFEEQVNMILIYSESFVKKIHCEWKSYMLNDILIALSLRIEHIKMCAINLNKF